MDRLEDLTRAAHADESWRMDIPGVGGVTAYRSQADGAVVVEIDTPDATEAAGTADGNGVPRLRVYVNEDAVWEHPPYPYEDAAITVKDRDSGVEHEGPSPEAIARRLYGPEATVQYSKDPNSPWQAHAVTPADSQGRRAWMVRAEWYLDEEAQAAREDR